MARPGSPRVILAADKRLERILERGTLSGVFFFTGDATRLRDEAVRRLVEAALDPATRDFNYNLFRGADLQAEQLASALAMPPMLAERRVVVLTEVERLTAGARKVVIESLARLPADVTFIVTATIPRGSKASFYRDLRERCETLEWNELREEEIPVWAIERARQRYGFELPPEAAQALTGAVGADLSVVDAELAKLAAAAEEGKITLAVARSLLPGSLRSVDRWEWLDSVAERRYEGALRQLDGVLTRDSGVGLVAAMVEQHLYLGLALEGGAGLVGRTLDEARKPYLKWKAGIYARQAGRWRPGELERALRLMRRADRRLKTGGGEREVLQELLLALRLLARRAA